MIQVSRLDHITITSRDPENSIAFYRDILGMSVANEWPGELTALQAGDTFLAISWRQKGKNLTKIPDIAIHHFALRVSREDFTRAQSWLPSKGIQVELEDNGVNGS